VFSVVLACFHLLLVLIGYYGVLLTFLGFDGHGGDDEGYDDAKLR